MPDRQIDWRPSTWNGTAEHTDGNVYYALDNEKGYIPAEVVNPNCRSLVNVGIRLGYGIAEIQFEDGKLVTKSIQNFEQFWRLHFRKCSKHVSNSCSRIDYTFEEIL